MTLKQASATRTATWLYAAAVSFTVTVPIGSHYSACGLETVDEAKISFYKLLDEFF